MSTDHRWFDPSHPPEQAFSIAAPLFVSIPAGWQALWKDTLRQLVSVRTADREFSLNYLSLELEDSLLQLDMPSPDPVLLGIARRCAERSKFICRQCGRRGKLRQFNTHEAAALCAQCAAPELLGRAIDDVIRFPSLICIGGRADKLRRVPEVLRKLFARAARQSALNDDVAEPSMDAAEFRRWVAHLEQVRSFLPPSASAPI